VPLFSRRKIKEWMNPRGVKTTSNSQNVETEDATELARAPVKAPTTTPAPTLGPIARSTDTCTTEPSTNSTAAIAAAASRIRQAIPPIESAATSRLGTTLDAIPASEATAISANNGTNVDSILAGRRHFLSLRGRAPRNTRTLK